MFLKLIILYSINANPLNSKKTYTLTTIKLLVLQKLSFLGVTIDSKLNWKPHINRVSNIVARSIGILNKLKQYFPPEILLTLYHTLILPYLSYCNIAWAVNLNKFEILNPWASFETTNIDNLFRLQKRALRICAGATYRSHTKHLFHTFKVLNIYDINKLQIAMFMYRVYNNSLPAHLNNLFTRVSDIHNYPTRFSESNFLNTSCSSHLRRHSIFYLGPKLWQNIGAKLINNPSLYSFKTSFKKSLISVYGE